MGCAKINLFDVLDTMNIGRVNVRNQFLVGSFLVSLYAVSKILKSDLGAPFCPGPLRPRVAGDGLSPALLVGICCQIGFESPL